MIFKGDYQFRGTHADKVIRLCAPFDRNKNTIFRRYLDVYIIAPIIGFLYNRTATLDSTSSTANILYDALSRELDTLWFHYRLIMLLDANYEVDYEKRIDKAFRLYGKEESKPDEEHFESFVRGGIDVLYEKLIEHANTEEDYLNNLHDFVNEFEDRYGESIEEVIDLCQLARS